MEIADGGFGGGRPTGRSSQMVAHGGEGFSEDDGDDGGAYSADGEMMECSGAEDKLMLNAQVNRSSS